VKRLAVWAAWCIGAVILQVSVTLWFLIGNDWYTVHWNVTDGASGWRALMPYYAWPILATYGGALIVVAGVIVAAGRSAIILRERKAIDIREAAVGLQEAHVRIASAKAERTMAEAEGIKQACREQMARCRQEAAAQIEDANARLQRSVDTNIGRQRTIQRLRERVKELEGEE